MDVIEQQLSTHDIDPIDLVETLAEYRSLDFDRISNDRIALAVEGIWRTYSVALNWAAHAGQLRLLCTFEFELPEAGATAAATRLPFPDAKPVPTPEMVLREVMEKANDQCWGGAFSWWPEHKMMAYRLSLPLAGGGVATAGQIDQLIVGAAEACEEFMPAFQHVASGETDADAALELVFGGQFGMA